ncbi:MAG: ABC transporter substrate-binding protein [Dehalococcoidia bacterium]|nr:ABC transporter substrate-binding protein [Dehalococcoidia bacterium]
MLKSSSLGVWSLLAAVAVMAVLFSGCGPAAQQAGTEEEKTNREKLQDTGAKAADQLEIAKERGGRLTIPDSGAFGNPNDPHLTATATGRTYSMPVTNGILKRNIYDNFAITPDLAKSWEVSKDGLTYTFKFNQGVKFHNAAPVNGREFTSEDAKYTLMRMTADPSVILEKWKPRFQRALDFGKMEGMETPDKYTLVVKLKEPYAPFIDAVSQPGTQVLPREFVEKFPEKIVLEGMIGTGPFIPNDYKHQSIASFKKNPDYWKKDSQGGQLPYLDEVAVLYFADVPAKYAAFRARQLDVTGVTGEIIAPMMRDEPGVKNYFVLAQSIMVYRFNMKFKPYQDVRVRRAIHLAIDRQQFALIIGQGLAVPTGPVTPAFRDLANTNEWLLQQPGYRQPKDQDIAEAKRLMKEAGYEEGFTTQALFNTNTGDHISLLQDQLKPLKITLKSEQVDYAGQWVPRATAGEFELAYMAHSVSTDADSVLSAHLLSGAPRNYGKFSDPILDDLILKQSRAVTLEERRKWAQEAEKRELEVMPIAFVYANAYADLAHPWVHNAGDGPLAGSLPFMAEQAWVEKH